MNNARNRRKRSDIKYKLREPIIIKGLPKKEVKEMFLYKKNCLNINIKDLKNEKWYPIPEWEEFYHMSNFLRLKSVRFNRIRKLRINKKGYFDTSFHNHMKTKYVEYARVVASVFLSNPLQLPQLNHKNGVRWDNRPSNLEWVTPKGNIHHSMIVLGNDREKIPIVQLTLLGEFVRQWDSITDASNFFGGSTANICLCCQGKLNYCYGYIWLYKKDYEKNGLNGRKVFRSHRPVIQFKMDGTYLKKWDTLLDAAVSIKVGSSSVIRCVEGEFMKCSCMGFRWKYG